MLTASPVTEVKGAYQRGTTGDAPAQYHVQIARDAAFLDIVTDASVPESITELDAKNLGAGDYHVRVSAVDADRFEGPFGPTVDLHVVSLATPASAAWSQEVGVGDALAGLTCSIDGAPMAPISGDVRLDRFRAHDLKCAKGADRTGAVALHLDAEPFDLTWSLGSADAKAHTGVLRAEAKDKAGHPVEHASLALATSPGADVGAFATQTPGVYTAKLGWSKAPSKLAAKVTANGEAHGELALALPGEDGAVVPAPDLEPKTTFGELGVEGGIAGAQPGIGWTAALRAGVRHDVGKFELSINALAGVEQRSSDATGALPLSLSRGTAVTSYTTHELVYTVGLPLEARYKLGASPFSLGLGVTPFIAFESANVSSLGGNVALPTPNPVFGANALGVLHLVAGPGTVVLAGGIRFSTTQTRQLSDVDLLGPYVSLGYRLAL